MPSFLYVSPFGAHITPRRTKPQIKIIRKNVRIRPVGNRWKMIPLALVYIDDA